MARQLRQCGDMENQQPDTSGIAIVMWIAMGLAWVLAAVVFSDNHPDFALEILAGSLPPLWLGGVINSLHKIEHHLRPPAAQTERAAAANASSRPAEPMPFGAMYPQASSES